MDKKKENDVVKFLHGIGEKIRSKDSNEKEGKRNMVHPSIDLLIDLEQGKLSEEDRFKIYLHNAICDDCYKIHTNLRYQMSAFEDEDQFDNIVKKDEKLKDKPTSSPGKKTIISTILLGGMLAYATIGDKVNSEYQNTTQQNAQVETAKTDYKASALENLTQALAPNKAFAQTNQNYQRPDDATLKKWMNQPVEETLAGTNYTKVNDDNYQSEVLGSDKPAMVIFYGAEEGSQGLGALTRALADKFENEINVFAYKIDDQKSMTRAEFEKLAENYPLEKAPALLFYETKDFGSGTEYLSQLHGGIKTLDFLKGEIEFYSEAIPKQFID